MHLLHLKVLKRIQVTVRGPPSAGTGPGGILTRVSTERRKYFKRRSRFKDQK